MLFNRGEVSQAKSNFPTRSNKTLMEHRALFESSGLKLSQIWPTASTYTILEAVAS
jgi:hypothetical protein